MSKETEKYEVQETVAQLRDLKESLDSYQQYWIEEAICSLVGMERKIEELTK